MILTILRGLAWIFVLCCLVFGALVFFGAAS